MFALLFLLLFLGIKPAPIDDDLIKDFPVSELVDETTTDCTENPSSGGPMDQTLKLDLIDPLKSDEIMTTTTPIDSMFRQDTTEIARPMVVPVKPPVPNPDLEPKPQPPSAITPEPSALLFTLFGTVFLFFLLVRKRLSRF